MNWWSYEPTDRERLGDILSAIEAIDSHKARGPLDDDLIIDAIRIRLIEIGEATKALDPQLLAATPTIPWSEIAKMRDKLTHHYFDLSHDVVRTTIHVDLPPLKETVLRMLSN